MEFIYKIIILYIGDNVKDSKYYKKIMKRNKRYNDVWLSKLLISIIIVLVCLILCNFSYKFEDKFKNDVLENNMRFDVFNRVYSKFINNIDEDVMVSNVLGDVEYEEVDGHYKFNYGIDSMVEVLKPGIIVFNGVQDSLGNTGMVQGNDGVDIWYSGVTLKEYGLYDYVSVGDILGLSNDEYVIISVYDDGKLLDYEEYI